MECTKINCTMQAGTPTDNCGENCPWRTIAKTGDLDLISRTAAIEALSTPCDKRYRHGVWETCLDNIETAIRNISTMDAVPVVRCRDCEHFIDMSGTSYPSYCYKHSTFDADGEFDNAFSVEPNKYCAWGERRGSE